MITVAPGATYEATLELGIPGLVGTLQLGTYDGDTATQALSATAVNEIGSSGVYVATRTAPGTAGQYVLIWSQDGTLDPDQITTEDLVVTHSRTVAGSPAGRDLCTLDDVYGYIPGFETDDPDNEATIAKLQALISGRSRSIYQDTGREFVAIAGADPRTFDLTASICQRRSMPIGDAASIDQIELFDFDGSTSLGIIDPSFYVLDPRIREEWEPYTRLRFPRRPSASLSIAPGRTLVITATWGFPQIPDDIREACAALVVTTALTDVAQAGTDLSDAVDRTFNASGLIRWALETIQKYADPGFA